MKDPKEYTVEQSGPATVEEFLLLADKVRTKAQNFRSRRDYWFEETDPYQFDSFRKWVLANKERYQKEDLMPVLKAADVKDPMFIQEGVVTWSVGEFKNYRRAWRYVNGNWGNFFDNVPQHGSTRPSEGISEITPILSNHGLQKDGFDPMRLFDATEEKWVTRTGKRLLWNGIDNTLNEFDSTDLLVYDAYSVFSYQDVGTTSAQSPIRARYTTQQMLEKAIKTDPKVFHMQYFNLAPVVMEAEGRSAYYMFPYFMHLFPMGTPESAIEEFFETEVYTGQGDEKYLSFYKKYPPTVAGIRKLWEDTKPGSAYHTAAKNCYLRAMAKQLGASQSIPEADFLRDFGGAYEGIGKYFTKDNRRRHANEYFDFQQLKWFMVIHGKIVGNQGTTWKALRDKLHPFYHPIVEKWTALTKGSLDLANNFQGIFHDDEANNIMIAMVYFDQYCHAMVKDRENVKLVSGYYFGETTLYPLYRLITNQGGRCKLIQPLIEYNGTDWQRYKQTTLYGKLIGHFESLTKNSKTVLSLTYDNLYYATKLAMRLSESVLASPPGLSAIQMNGSGFDIDKIVLAAAGVFDKALFTEDNLYQSCGYFKKIVQSEYAWNFLGRKSGSSTIYPVIGGVLSSQSISSNRPIVTILPESDDWKNPFKFSTTVTSGTAPTDEHEIIYPLTYVGYGNGKHDYTIPMSLGFMTGPGITVNWINQQTTQALFNSSAGRQRNGILHAGYSIANFLGFIKDSSNIRYQCPFTVSYGMVLSHFVTYNTIALSTSNGVNKDGCITTIRHGLPWLMIQSRMNGIDVPSRQAMITMVDTLPPYRKYVDIVNYFKQDFGFTPDNDFLREAVKDARTLLAQLEPLRSKNPADTQQETFPHRMKSTREADKPNYPTINGATTRKVGMVSSETFIFDVGNFRPRFDEEMESPLPYTEVATGVVSSIPLAYMKYWPGTLFNKQEITKYYQDFRYMGTEMPRLTVAALFNDAHTESWKKANKYDNLLTRLQANYPEMDNYAKGLINSQGALVAFGANTNTGLMFSLGGASGYHYDRYKLNPPQYQYLGSYRSCDKQFFELGFAEWHHNVGYYRQSDGFSELIGNNIMTNNVYLTRTTRCILGRWGQLWGDAIPLSIQPVRYVNTMLDYTRQLASSSDYKNINRFLDKMKTNLGNAVNLYGPLAGVFAPPRSLNGNTGTLLGHLRSDIGNDIRTKPVARDRTTMSYEFTTACLLLRKYGRLPMYHPHYHRDIHIERTLIDMAILNLRLELGQPWIKSVGTNTTIEKLWHVNEFLVRYDLYSGTIPPYTRLLNEYGWLSLLGIWGFDMSGGELNTTNSKVLGLDNQGNVFKTSLGVLDITLNEDAGEMAKLLTPVNGMTLYEVLKKDIPGAKYGLFHYESQFGSGGKVTDMLLIHVGVLRDYECNNAGWKHMRDISAEHPEAKTRFFKEAYEGGKWNIFDKDAYDSPFSIIVQELPPGGNKDIPVGMVPMYIMPWALLDEDGNIEAFLCTDDPVQYYQSLDIEIVEKYGRIQQWHNGKRIDDPSTSWKIETNRTGWN